MAECPSTAIFMLPRKNLVIFIDETRNDHTNRGGDGATRGHGETSRRRASRTIEIFEIVEIRSQSALVRARACDLVSARFL